MKRIFILTILIGLLCTGCGSMAEEAPEHIPDNNSDLVSIKDQISSAPAASVKPDILDVDRPIHAPEPSPSFTTIATEISNIENSALPRIDIVLENEEFILSKEDYEPCSITISNAGEYDLAETVAKVRLRGNSTADLAKHPLRIKFAEKTSVFGGGNEKSWNLIANVFDRTSIHNAVAFHLYDYLTADDAFVPMCEFVDVYINGYYQGVYNLCDQVEPGSTRVPIDGHVQEIPEATDYLIVQDMRVTYQDSGEQEGLDWFWMAKENVAFEVKSPKTDEEGYSEAYTQYVKQRMDDIYATILSKDYEKICAVVDVESMINGFMTSAIVKDQDINKASVYYYLPHDGKLTFGPAWDFDLAFGSGEIGSPTDEPEGIMDNFMFAALWEVPEFQAAYKERFIKARDQVETVLCTKIDQLCGDYYASFENEYANWTSHYDYENEEMHGLDYAGQIDYMKYWIAERLRFLYTYYGFSNAE